MDTAQPPTPEKTQPTPPQGEGMDYQAMPEAPVSGGAPADVSGEAEKGIVPSRWEQFGQSLKQTSSASPVGFSPDDPGAWVRGVVEHFTSNDAESRGEKKLSPADANKQFPGMPVPFNEDVYPSVAQLRYDHNEHMQKVQAWKERGGATPWTDAAAGLAGGFLDPVNLGLSLATGGVSKLAGIAPTLGNVFLQNLAINEITGIPSYLQEKREGQDVSFLGSQEQALEGAVGGTAFHYALGGLVSAFKKGYEFVRRTPPETQAATVREVVAQKEFGSKVNLDDAMELESSRQAGQIAEGTSENGYVFKQVEHPSEKPFYMARRGQDNVKVDFQAYGPGSYAVDDPMVANNSVSSPEGGSPGTIGHLDVLEGAKFLDLSQATDTPEMKPLLEAVDAKFGGVASDAIEAAPNGLTVKDLLDGVHDQIDSGKLPPTALSDIQEIVKKMGYDGYQYVEDHGDFGKKNGAMLFDENVKPSMEYDANPELTPVRTDSQEKSFGDQSEMRSNSQHASDTVDSDLRKFSHEASLNSTKDYMDPIVDEQVKNVMARLEALAKDDPSVREDMKALQKEKALDAKEISLLKELADCVVGSMV